jgi:hypothetical protein
MKVLLLGGAGEMYTPATKDIVKRDRYPCGHQSG